MNKYHTLKDILNKYNIKKEAFNYQILIIFTIMSSNKQSITNYYDQAFLFACTHQIQNTVIVIMD